MNKRIILLFVLSRLAFVAGQAQGIDFKSNTSWSVIKEQAKSNKRYIFMDVSATFCAPCHMMEKQVFAKDSVARFYNKNFISVKLQADKTPNDNRQVKNWYTTVEQILKKYNVTAYPTYLFFSPDGELVYRFIGTASPERFVSIGADALKPELSVKGQIAAFKNRQMKLEDEGRFAMFLSGQGYSKEAESVAKDYNARFLNNVEDTVLKSESNLEFISTFPFMLSPADHYFRLFYNNSREMDSLRKLPGSSYRLTNRVIMFTEIWDKIYADGSKTIKDPHPDWDRIRRAIAGKYSADRADKLIPVEKYRFYCKAQDWPQAIESGVALMKDPQFSTPALNADMMNHVAFNIFQYSHNNSDTKIATKWAQLEIARSPDVFTIIHTYSCLLYKDKKLKQAMIEAQRSINLLKQNGERDDKDTLLPIYQENLRKMKNGADPKAFKRPMYDGISI